MKWKVKVGHLWFGFESLKECMKFLNYHKPNKFKLRYN